MSNHKGLPWILIAVVCVVVSVFFDFYDTGSLSTSGQIQLEFLFTQFSVYLGVWQSIFTDISVIFASAEAFADFVQILLSPPFLLLGAAFLLFGLTGRTLPKLGAILLLVFPIVYLVCNIIIPLFSGGDFVALFGYLQAGFYLQLIGGVLGFLGGSLNHRED